MGSPTRIQILAPLLACRDDYVIDFWHLLRGKATAYVRSLRVERVVGMG